jgi:hypothetical protein
MPYLVKKKNTGTDSFLILGTPVTSELFSLYTIYAILLYDYINIWVHNKISILNNDYGVKCPSSYYRTVFSTKYNCCQIEHMLNIDYFKNILAKKGVYPFIKQIL